MLITILCLSLSFLRSLLTYGMIRYRFESKPVWIMTSNYSQQTRKPTKSAHRPTDLDMTSSPVGRLPLVTLAVRTVLGLCSRFWAASTSMLGLDQHISTSRSHSYSHQHLLSSTSFTHAYCTNHSFVFIAN